MVAVGFVQYTFLTTIWKTSLVCVDKQDAFAEDQDASRQVSVAPRFEHLCDGSWAGVASELWYTSAVT